MSTNFHDDFRSSAPQMTRAGVETALGQLDAAHGAEVSRAMAAESALTSSIGAAPGAVSLLTGTAASGQKVVPLASSTSGYVVGQTAWITKPDGSTYEPCTIDSISAGVSVTVTSTDPTSSGGNLVHSYTTGDLFAVTPEELAQMRTGYPTSADALRALRVNLASFGAVGDDSTDNAAAIGAWVTYLAAHPGCVAYVPGGSGFRSSVTAMIPSTVHLEMESAIRTIASAGTAIVGVQWGTAGTTGSGMRIIARASRVTQSDWSSDNDIGIRVYNATACQISLYADGFDIPWELIGDGSGAALNAITGQALWGKYAGSLCSNNSGWCNENVGLGMAFRAGTGKNNGSSRYGIRVWSRDASYPQNNHNVFIKPDFELLGTLASPGESIPVLMEGGQFNAVLDARMENCGNTFARETGSTVTKNVYEIGYGGSATSGPTQLRCIVDSSSAPYSMAIKRSRFTDMYDRPGVRVWHSGPVFKRWCDYDGGSNCNIADVHFAITSAATSLPYGTLADFTPGSRYLTIAAASRGLGINVDCSVQKRFLIRQDCETAYPARVSVVFFDSSGTMLGSAEVPEKDASDVVAASTNFTGLSNTATACSWGATPGTSTYPPVLYIGAPSSAASMRVIVWAASGGTEARIRSFGVWAVDGLDGCSTAWTGNEGLAPTGSNVATTAPTTGTYVRGQRILNATPSHSGVEGWVCTSAPSTFYAFGSIA